jgi:hypothetical protein
MDTVVPCVGPVDSKELLEHLLRRHVRQRNSGDHRHEKKARPSGGEIHCRHKHGNPRDNHVILVREDRDHVVKNRGFDGVVEKTEHCLIHAAKYSQHLSGTQGRAIEGTWQSAAPFL